MDDIIKKDLEGSFRGPIWRTTATHTCQHCDEIQSAAPQHKLYNLRRLSQLVVHISIIKVKLI
jgi:hypothetical protein